MITYDYVCEACGHEWSAEQGIKDEPVRDCPSCGEPKAKRLISGSGAFALKGGCWERDGYK